MLHSLSQAAHLCGVEPRLGHDAAGQAVGLLQQRLEQVLRLNQLHSTRTSGQQSGEHAVQGERHMLKNELHTQHASGPACAAAAKQPQHPVRTAPTCWL